MEEELKFTLTDIPEPIFTIRQEDIEQMLKLVAQK
jgi:hypothetical protein